MKTIACGDLVPGCPVVASAATEEELLAKVAKHATEDHGMVITPELVAAVKGVIKDDGK